MATKIVIIFATLLCLFMVLISAKADVVDAESVEGFCPEPRPIPIEMDLDWALGFTMKAKFVPIASELHYISTAVRLTGKTLTSWTDLNTLCLEVTSNDFRPIITTGFGKTFYSMCEVEGVGALKCIPGDGPSDNVDVDSPAPVAFNGDTFSVVVIWTDFKKYMLAISCLPGGPKTWSVISTEQKVDAATKDAILEHVKAFGFDPKKAREASYDLC